MGRRRKLVHRGIYHERTKVKDGSGPREKAFSDAWQKENELRVHAMFIPPCSTLEFLMRENDRLLPVSQETATAVATMIQWLGSNIGRCFLEGALKKAGYCIVSLGNK